MSQHTSFIPPDVIPPDPPIVKAITLGFSVLMSVILLAFIGYICFDFLADFVEYPLPQDTLHEHAMHEQCGPFISEFLGMNFPGQYAPMFGKNARSKNYDLTKEDHERAIQRFQEMLQGSKEVSVEIVRWNDLRRAASERYWLSYDSNLAMELCQQTELFEGTSISPLLDLYLPDLVFTFYPSEVRISMVGSPPDSFVQAPLLYITLGSGMQRWEGDFGNGFTAALTNAQLRGGGTVRSNVATWLPFFPLDSFPTMPDLEEE